MKVRITSSVPEALECAKKNIPYIVVLNDYNKTQELPNGAYCVESENDISDEYLERVYRRFAGLPWDIARTKRLIIREMTESDVPRLYELYADESVTRYMEPLFEDMEKELEYTRAYIKNIYGFYGFGIWVIALKESGEVIGRAGLEDKEGRDGLELGFMLGAKYRHQGYAYEACRAVMEYAKNELGEDRIYAVVSRENEPSMRLCKRLGVVVISPEPLTFQSIS